MTEETVDQSAPAEGIRVTHGMGTMVATSSTKRPVRATALAERRDAADAARLAGAPIT